MRVLSINVNNQILKLNTKITLIVAFLCLCSGSRVISSVKNICFVSGILAFLYIFSKISKWNFKNLCHYCGLFIILFCLQYIAFSWNTIPGLLNLLAKIILSSSIIIILGLQFKYYYYKVLVLFSIISIPFWILQLMGISFNLFDLPFIKSVLIFNCPMEPSIRNSGPFWEPGAFACYLILAFVMFIDEYRFIYDNKKSSLVLLIALGTTMSTTGYLCFFVLILLFLIVRLRSKIKYLLALFCTFVSIYAFQSIDFLQEKMNEQTESSIGYYEMQDFSSTRLGSLLFDLHYIQKHPVIGNGLSSQTRYADHPFLVQAWKDGTESHSGNGFGDFIAKFGITAFVFFVYLFIKYNCDVNKQYLLIYLIILVLTLQGECLLDYPLYLGLPFLKLKGVTVKNIQ